jgi:hypothetical protein
MNSKLKALGIASLKQSAFSQRDWKVWEGLWPALEAMVDEGAIIVVKLDGNRAQDELPKRYTVVLSGGRLGEEFYHKDTSDLEGALCEAVIFYTERVWNRDTSPR